MIKAHYHFHGFTLRALRIEDAERMYAGWTGCDEATRYMAWNTHQSVQEAEDFIRGTWKRRREETAWIYGVQTAETLIGHVGFGQDNATWKYDFGFILDKRYWGRGYATKIVVGLTGIVFTLPGVRRLGACVDVDNAASARVLEKCGFEREGVLKSWERNPNVSDQPRDVLSFAKVR